MVKITFKIPILTSEEFDKRKIRVDMKEEPQTYAEAIFTNKPNQPHKKGKQ
jgi:hypothetical protein